MSFSVSELDSGVWIHVTVAVTSPILELVSVHFLVTTADFSLSFYSNRLEFERNAFHNCDLALPS